MTVFDLFGKRALEREERLEQALAHDLKNPMTSVMGCLTFLLQEEGDRRTQRRLLQLALQGCRNQLEMLEAVTDAGRLESGDLRPETGSVDLRRVAERARAQSASAAETMGVALDVKVDEGAAQWEGDEDLVGRAASHLLAHAVRYSPRRATVSLRVARGGPGVVLRTVDRGPAPAPGSPLFDRYGRIEIQPPGRRGVGLGLYFARLVAEAHGGSLSAGSRPEGTVVELSLGRAGGRSLA